MNENDGADENGVPLPSESAKKKLLVLCSTFDECMDYGIDPDGLKNSENLSSEESFMDLNLSTGWIDGILNTVTIKKSENYHVSAFFCDDKERGTFVKLFSSIALWSNIMNEKFGSKNETATSSDIESYFKSLKVGILERKRHRADDFVRISMDFANSEIKLNAMMQTVKLESPNIRKRSNSIQERSPNSLSKFLLIQVMA